MLDRYRRSARAWAGTLSSWRSASREGIAGWGASVQHLPDARRLQGWEDKRNGLGLRIQEEEQRLVGLAGTAGRQGLDGLPGQEESHAAVLGRLPILREHFQPIRAKPRQIFAHRPWDALALPEVPATQDRMVLHKGDHRPGEVQ